VLEPGNPVDPSSVFGYYPGDDRTRRRREQISIDSPSTVALDVELVHTPRASSSLAGETIYGQPLSAADPYAKSDRAMVIAQITDTHIKPEGVLAYGRVDTAAYLARAVEHLLALRPRPDVVLATGDLVDGGLPEEYRRLRHLLAPLSMPVYLIPGNHDDREALAGAFTDHAYLPRGGQFMHYVIESHPVRLIALDTLVPGRIGGELCAERLVWLRARLAAAPTRPTLVFMHHPPFVTGIAQMDAHGLANAGAFAEIVRGHPQIERIVCGHLHRPIQSRVGGILASTAPSTAHQVALDLAEEPLAFTMEPPACQLHVWSAETGLVTHTSYIGQFDGPYLFATGAKRAG
jgi:3',5'-cyclic-AMP phosphodiesterase